MPANRLLLDAALRRPTSRRPVWMMRQAGRYLPGYQAARRRHDFLTLCRTPEAAAEVSIEPYRTFGMDAIIVFSDILVPCEAMGLTVEFTDGEGPRFPNPLTPGGESRFKPVRSSRDMPFVGDAIARIRRQTDDAVPVLGFAGSPWTLACYMIEGGGSRNFETIKTWMWTDPRRLHAVLESITAVIIDSIQFQVASGASAFQIFDTWGGILSPRHWREFSLPYIRRIFQAAQTAEAPGILYTKGSAANVEDAVGSGAAVLSVDWTLDLEHVRELAGGHCAIQGNLDPVTLLTTPAIVEAETRAMLRSFGGGPGLIANLGHGILPSTPVENARAFIRAVQQTPLVSGGGAA